MRKILALGLLVGFYFLDGAAQPAAPPQQLMVKPKGQIVCYKNDVNHPIYLPPRFEANPAGRTQAADIQVEYVGFPPDAQASFVRAVDIWKTLIQSNVRINIRAAWVPQDANVLGSAIWGNAFANFDGAPKLNVFYPVALAEKIAGKKLNGDPNPTTGNDYDIYAFFNSTQSRWNFTDTPTPNTYNFTTVVLHEIGHGLGFTDSYDLENGLGSFGVQTTATPMIFDVGVESGAGARLINQANNTAALATALTNANVNYNPSRSLVGVASEKPKLYAPSEWSSGSSIAHLDQATYSGTNNRLMRPQLDLNSVVLDPGPFVLNMFADMGWVAPAIVHTPLKDTEVTSNDFTVSVTASSDGTTGYSINNQVKLRYQINGGAEVELVQSPTSGNQYIFTLPKPSQPTASTNYSYYLVVTDSYNGQNRTFSKPGQFIRPGDSDLQATFQFKAGPDTTIPVIVHTPKDFVLEGTTSLELKVLVTDNIGVQGAKIDYKINAGSLQMLSLVQDNDTTSLYKATLPTTGLVNGTTISYRITATDNSSNANSALAPTATTFYEVAVIGTAPAQNSYSNDFNSPSSDFFGNGYSIITPAGFSNGAIHSSHPYPEAGSGSLNFSYQLRVPIKVKAQGASIKFDEIVLVEPGEPGSGFGTDAFYDYVVTEASKDGGVSWKPVEDGYDSRANADWLAKYNSSIISNISQGKGDPTLFKPRVLDLLKNFKAGDEVLIRFRLFSDPAAAGWGWAIDNLNIQTPITGFERTLAEASFTIYPNPSASSKLVLKLETPNDNLIKVHFLTANGSAQQELSIQPVNKQIEQEVNVGDWSDGFYIVKAEVGGAIVTRKFVKSR
ncbi:MAG: T9SS type A sorting domain-containing protein [Cytophagales bacterium]